jgi:nucleoside-diphosphate-sugar epimerase
VTGASGFVGASLARRLLRDGHDVHLLLRQGYAPWRIDEIRGQVALHLAALADREQVDAVVREVRPEWIFHLATHGAYSSQTDLDEIVQTNVLGTINLVEACLRAGFDAFVNTGSSSEYGVKDHAPSEREWLEPNSYYAVTKASASLYCRYTAQRHGVHLPTLRLYSVYGPYEEPTRLVPTLLRLGLEGRLPPLVNPETARDFVYVEDVVEAYLTAAAGKRDELGAIYNVGTGIQTTLREAVELTRSLLGVDAEPSWGTMAARIWDTEVWVSDPRQIRDRLGWEPRYTLEQGLRHYLAWLRARTSLDHAATDVDTRA